MKLINLSMGKKQLKMSQNEWESVGKKAGWMKISQQIPPQQLPVQQPQGQSQQPQTITKSPVAGQAFQEALDPSMRTLFTKALQGSGLSKQKVLPFLQQLFASMGDVPISKITGVIKILADEESNRAKPQQPVQQPTVQQPPVQQAQG